ncbi:MAG: SDR family oxidoreductase [Caenispirillum sp.]|nr:SDR family oxidoreductase [Caenispirillum sp.]
MKIFVTGATGNIGSKVVEELVAAGHQVIGLYRSEDKVAALRAAGAEAYKGSITDPEGLKDGIARCDGVIHLAFNHDFSRYVQNCEADRDVVTALGAALAGSGRPLVVTSATLVANVVAGEPALEDTPAVRASAQPRAASEEAADAVAAAGVPVSVVRLPQVHDPRTQGLLTPAIGLFREKRLCAYVGDGLNRWPAAHVADVARLYRLAIERAEPNARYHAVAEDGLPMRDIVNAIGARLGLAVEALEAEQATGFFGWLSHFATLDMPASSALTRRRLGWEPRGPSLITDLEHLETGGR